MSDLNLPGLLLRETFTLRRASRTPEPDLVMDDAAQVDAYTNAGRDAQVMAPTHLFHSAQACQVIQPGDTVLDLGCGPGTQLVQLASLCPQAQFIGLDLSAPMLEQAQQFAGKSRVTNVQLLRHDMTDLSSLADHSIDCAISSMTLHHLPNVADLARCFTEIARVLKPGGGVYLADFLRLRSTRSMQAFASQHEAAQSPAFTRDYRNSLHAAFTFNDFRQAAEPLADRVTLFRTRPIALFIAIKSAPRRQPDAEMNARLQISVNRLGQTARSDLKAISLMFRLGGLRNGRLT